MFFIKRKEPHKIHLIPTIKTPDFTILGTKLESKRFFLMPLQQKTPPKDIRKPHNLAF